MASIEQAKRSSAVCSFSGNSTPCFFTAMVAFSMFEAPSVRR